MSRAIAAKAFYPQGRPSGSTCGWIGAALLVHWIVRRVPTHLARELTAAATGAVIGLGSAWFELRLIPRMVRALTDGRSPPRPDLLLRHPVRRRHPRRDDEPARDCPSTGACSRTTSPRNTGTSCWAAASLVALGILTLVSFLINFVRQLNRMLGPGTLVSLLLGRYHRPVAEERIFMFLDLNDSTAIAAALGPCASTTSRTTSSTTSPEPVLETRGRIYQYVGDEAVVTVDDRARTPPGNCLRCVFLVIERIHEQKDRYLAPYGIVPSSRPASTAGPSSPRRSATSEGHRPQLATRVNTGGPGRGAVPARWSGACWCRRGAACDRCPAAEELEVEDMGEQELRGMRPRRSVSTVSGHVQRTLAGAPSHRRHHPNQTPA